MDCHIILQQRWVYSATAESKFRVCNLGEPHARPPQDMRRKKNITERKKEIVRTTVNRVYGLSSAESLPRSKRGLLPVGLCYHHRAWEPPLLVSQLYLIVVSIYSFFLQGSG